MRTAIANNACKFHEDRLKDGVTIYFIVEKPRVSGERAGVHGTRSALWRTVHTVKSTYVVQRAYGQPCVLCMGSQEAKTEIYLRHCCYDSGPHSSCLWDSLAGPVRLIVTFQITLTLTFTISQRSNMSRIVHYSQWFVAHLSSVSIVPMRRLCRMCHEAGGICCC